MNIGKIVRGVVLAAAPVAAGALGAPGAAVMLGGSLVAGGGTKALGKLAAPLLGGRKAHKAASPVAAVLAALGLADTLPPELVEQAVRLLLPNGEAEPGSLQIAVVVGALAVLWHSIVKGLKEIRS